MNIYAATRDSMEWAVKNLSVQPDFVIADAMALNIDLSDSIRRERGCEEFSSCGGFHSSENRPGFNHGRLHKEYPAYNFLKNAGYGTAEHLKALETFGPCEHHRKSFEPIKSMSTRKED